MQAETLVQSFKATAATFADQPALQAFGSDRVISWAEYADQSAAFARELAALRAGPGDVVAFLLTNRPEFHLAESAALRLGCVTFSLYATAAPEQMTFQLNHSGTQVLVTERRFLPVVHALPGVSRLELIDVDSLLRTAGPTPPPVSVRPDDVACLVYTSGTTGAPKAVELTHRGIIAMIRGTDALYTPPAVRRKLSYLPAAHIAERAFSQYEPMLSGAFVTTIEDGQCLPEALAAVSPTMFFGVPRVWEKLRTAIEAGARFDFSEMTWAVSGGAPCPPDLIKFFHALGVPLAETWGMSEMSGIATVNPPDSGRAGVGQPIGEVQVRLAPDNELLVRGVTVAAGYRGDPVATAEAFTSDGWLRTGDIAEIDDGHVTIIGRKKEVIITVAGKNISPAAIESAVTAETSLLSHICAIGNGRPYIVALAVADPERTAGLSPGELDTAVTAAIGHANTRLARAEQIKRFALVTDGWATGGDYLTATGKPRRAQISLDYADLIDQLYRTSD